MADRQRSFRGPARGLLAEFGATGEGTGRSCGELLSRLRLCRPQASAAARERLRVGARAIPSRGAEKIWLHLAVVGEGSDEPYPDLLVVLDSARDSIGRYREGRERVAMEFELALNEPHRLPASFFERYVEVSGIAPFGCRRCPSVFADFDAALEHAVNEHGDLEAISAIRGSALPESPPRRLRRASRRWLRRLRGGDAPVPEPLAWEAVRERDGTFVALSELGSVGPFASRGELESQALYITLELERRRGGGDRGRAE